MAYTETELTAVIRAAHRRRFHVQSDAWVGHSPDADRCYTCRVFAESAAEAVADVLARAGQEPQR